MKTEFPLRDEGFRIEVVPVNASTAGIKFIYPEVSFLFPAPEEWLTNLKKAYVELLHNGMTEIGLRLERARFEELSAELPAMNFRKKHERIEFQSEVESLPDDSGSPLIWKSETDLSFAAKALHSVAVGDPDYDPSEDARAALEYYVNDERFLRSPDCLQLGFFEGKLAALIVAQVKPDGWSRITYMGVHPEFRGKGLGKWVHRKGFAIMKSLGGKLYVGGTVSTNEGMIKLFRKHGCDETRVMEEWVWKK